MREFRAPATAAASRIERLEERYELPGERHSAVRAQASAVVRPEGLNPVKQDVPVDEQIDNVWIQSSGAD